MSHWSHTLIEMVTAHCKAQATWADPRRSGCNLGPFLNPELTDKVAAIHPQVGPSLPDRLVSLGKTRNECRTPIPSLNSVVVTVLYLNSPPLLHCESGARRPGMEGGPAPLNFSANSADEAITPEKIAVAAWALQPLIRSWIGRSCAHWLRSCSADCTREEGLEARQ